MSYNGPYIIAGMHRSGTSLLARMMSTMGFRLGTDFIPPDSGNPDGYLEDKDIVSLQRLILQTTVSATSPGWPDWGWSIHGNNNLDTACSKAQHRAQAYLLARESESLDGNLWGWKDPRSTLLLNLWQTLVPGLRVVAVYRQPWDVVAALQRVKPPVFLANPSWCLPIWEHYNKRLLEFAIRHPGQCILLNAQALASDPERLPRILAETWQLSLPSSALRQLVRPDRLNSQPPHDPLELLYRATFQEACSLYDSLQSCSSMPFSANIHSSQ